MSTEEQERAGTPVGVPPLSPLPGTHVGHSAHGILTPPAVPPGPPPQANPQAQPQPHHHTHHYAPASTPSRGPGSTTGKLFAGVAWAVLLLGLWLWGRDVADGMAARLATTGDVAAVGRPLGRQAPPHAHAPVPAAANAAPVSLTIDALGIQEGGIAARGLDEDGLLTPPPDASPDLVGWYAGGPRPGEAGAALLAGRAGADRDPGARRGVVHRLTALTPGERVDIRRSDGSTARFAVEDVQLYDRDRFDARKVYAARGRGRSELRLIVDGGSGGSGGSGARAGGGARGGGSSNVVVVSAYLTSLQKADAAGR
ncbi:sortase domain-containing protein [Streptomyces angustmyceticus]|uniref:sortase domain-containing protein n=1 Tax=Streptomyces angustmyceticus TaxID=285578 RepID=UPI0038515837